MTFLSYVLFTSKLMADDKNFVKPLENMKFLNELLT